MPRVELHDISPSDFFQNLRKQTGYSYAKLAAIIGVHPRSFSDWSGGTILIPLVAFLKLMELSSQKPIYAVLPDYWHIKAAAKKGAATRYKIYGNPGTPQGRSLGGRNSYLKFWSDPERAKNPTFFPKQIKIPGRSSTLAELIGIILGDGGISRYQLRVTLNGKEDVEYSRYVYGLIRGLFGVAPSFSEREGTIDVVVSRIKIVKFLLEQKLYIGSKVRHQVGVPKWICENLEYAKACVRGLFDTDGCFYVDRHCYKSKTYYNSALNFKNHSLPLTSFFKESLEKLQLHPTQKSNFSVSLRREKDILKFFEIIGSSNPKHIRKFGTFFLKKYGEVPKWTQRDRLESGLPP